MCAKIKNIILIVFSIFVLSIFYASLNSFAGEATPHTFKSGDIISADMLNEAFNSVDLSLAEAIIGEWSTQCWDSTSSSADSPGTGVLTVSSLTNISYTGVSCISRNTDGTGSLTILEFTPIGNMALITTHSDNTIMTNPILELTSNRIVVITQNSGIEKLTRQNTTPNKPLRLSATSSGLTVTLSWTDNSSDETGFKIIRKDSLTGNWSEIATTAADIISYTDTVSLSAKYWYRVKATNSNGDSVGSNVAKVEP